MQRVGVRHEPQLLRVQSRTSADNWCLNVQCRNNDGSACTFSDFSITFDAHMVSCAAGTDYDSNRGEYLDGATCQSCPANSVGAGGTATTCTCAANYWAKKSGSTWTCELCSGQRTKAAGSTILSGSGEVEDTVCVDAASCTDDHYLSGGECVACPVGSTSTDATSTTCECGASQYFADGSCNACPSTSTCASSSCSALTECKCPADHYVARPSGDWVCTECKSGQSRAATAIPSANNLVEDGNACSAATVCADNDYLAMDIDTGLNYCEECPVGSTSTDATSTTCEDSVGGASAEYGDCECYCDGIYQGNIDVDDGQGGVGVTESFCDNNGPPACPSEGFTCANPNTVNWAYDSLYTGAMFGAPSPGDSGPPPDGSTSDEYGDCECYCDGSLQGILPFDDGVPEGFCDNYGPGGGASQCPNMGGFTCANPFTVNWVHNPAYQGTSFSGR